MEMTIFWFLLMLSSATCQGIVYANVTSSADEVEITTVYSESSSASGALYLFVHIDANEDVDFSKSAILTLDRNSSLISIESPLDIGNYAVFVYDIESDGTLSNDVVYPATEVDLTVSSANSQASSMPALEACDISNSSAVITVECAFSSDDTTAGLQIIAQSMDSSIVHKLYVNRSMDLQSPITVEVEESGLYQVTVLIIDETTGILDSGVTQYNVEYQIVITVPATIPTVDTPDNDFILAISLSAALLVVFVIFVPVVAVIVALVCKRVNKKMGLYTVQVHKRHRKPKNKKSKKPGSNELCEMESPPPQSD